MSGAGKWIKKHPMETVGILAAGITGGMSLLPAAGAGVGAAAAGAAAGGAAPLGLGTASLFGAEAGLGAGLMGAAPAGALGSSILAPAAAAEGLGGGFAGLAGGASPLATEAAMSVAPMSGWEKFAAGMDKMQPYAKLANQAQGLLGPDQQQQMPPPMAPRPQQMASLPSSGLLPYGDPAEEEKWKRMQESGRFYG